jgi:protein kinase C substrate 80K-H
MRLWHPLISITVYKLAAFLPPSLVNYIGDKLAQFRSFLVSNGVLSHTRSGSAEGESQAVIDARNAIIAAESSLAGCRSKLDEYKVDLEKDYGPDGVFRAMKGSCISKDSGEYNYELCWMGSTKQKSKKGGSEALMGSFVRITTATVDEKTSSGEIRPREKIVLEYANGQTCWNGPARSTSVILECGENNELLKVSEDEKCVYSMQVTTPAVCGGLNGQGSHGHRDEL